MTESTKHLRWTPSGPSVEVRQVPSCVWSWTVRDETETIIQEGREGSRQEARRQAELWIRMRNARRLER
jgi:hypothetical protein